MVKVWFSFLFVGYFHVNALYLPPVKNVEKVEEIQNAICSITTKELEATANATITRQLNGVCTSSELNSKMDGLQTKLLQEIDGIKYILELNGFKVPEEPPPNKNPTSDHADFNDPVIGTRRDESVLKTPVVKSINNELTRTDEVLIYNDTLLQSDAGNKYFYYWKILDVHELLTKTDMYKSSPGFSVLGHTLHLQFYPNYSDAKHFAILLKPNSPGFLKRHRLIILNQLDPRLDLTSGVLYGIRSNERMWTVPEDKLIVKGFIVQNSLIVKVEILLNS